MSICLNMIVKNESARIERCLRSVSPYISTWSILDTGSDDDTVRRILDYFKDHSIPGYLEKGAFIDFSTTRNRALEMARRSDADYILLVDADMELAVEKVFPFNGLTADAYHMVQRGSGLTYWNSRLVKRTHDCKYVGVTHEYLDTRFEPARLHGAWFKDHADGANRPGKVDRDIALLAKDLERNPDNARSVYYLAMSYRDKGDPSAARALYEKRGTMGGWDEEVWHANLSAARCNLGLDNRAFIDKALFAYNQRPTRAEPLYDLAKYYREKGMHNSALLFINQLSLIDKPDDLLFVEDYPYDWGYKEEMSICGFYNPQFKNAGRDYCEELALSREAPEATREQAWNNLFHYSQPLSEICPSAKSRKIDFTPPDGFYPCNPSIAQADDGMVLNIRCVDYLIGNDGHYQMPSGNITTRNFLINLSDDLDILIKREVPPPANYPRAPHKVLGWEDIRLIPTADGELLCSASVCQMNDVGSPEIAIGELVTETFGIETIHWHMIRPEGLPQKPEKNWMPIIGTEPQAFIYSLDPLIIIDEHGDNILHSTPPIAAHHWSGSSQLIPFDDGYLCLIHERQASLDYTLGQRNYRRRFVWFDSQLRMRKISHRFFFGNGVGEFCCGMCEHPDGKRLVISYGVLDREAWLCTVNTDEVRAIMRDLPENEPETTFLGVVELPPQQLPKPGYNRPLLSDGEVVCAIKTAEKYGWPLHPERTKNWDVMLAIDAVLTHCPGIDSHIVDAGADRISTFLPILSKIGYARLDGINILEEKPEYVNGILYGPGNIEAMGYPPNSVSFIACLSVIEHGVNVEYFLRSAYDALKPGGFLFISTDYWPTSIDTEVRRGPYEWVILDKDMIGNIVFSARNLGFRFNSSISFEAGSPVCSHAGLDFTFFNMLMVKA